MTRKGLIMFDDFRFWLIKKLAGKSPVAINLRVFGSIVVGQDKGIIYGCMFDPPDDDCTYACVSLEDMVNRSIDGLKDIPKRLAAEK